MMRQAGTTGQSAVRGGWLSSLDHCNPTHCDALSRWWPQEAVETITMATRINNTAVTAKLSILRQLVIPLCPVWSQGYTPVGSVQALR